MLISPYFEARGTVREFERVLPIGRGLARTAIASLYHEWPGLPDLTLILRPCAQVEWIVKGKSERHLIVSESLMQ